MNRVTEVFVDLSGHSKYAGKLWSRVKGGRESASFQYGEEWLSAPERFPLEPLLTLDPSPHHTPMDRSLFGAIGDSSQPTSLGLLQELSNTDLSSPHVTPSI